MPKYRWSASSATLSATTTPLNDRTRPIWAFGYSRPTIWQRFSAAVPFLYRRAGGPGRLRVDPPPVLDMADPARGTVPRILAAGIQSTVVDPLGIAFRASSRAYQNRAAEYRAMHVHRALEVFRTTPPEADGINGAELATIQGRLVLSTQLLGGLVREDRAAEAWVNRRQNSSMSCGRNWEILRQRAEENGLHFQPLRIGADEPNFAILWVDSAQPPQPFDGRFLNISNPYGDERIRNWRGYSETWSIDGRQARMIPLALYALDFPKVPLVLIDFRNPGKAKRREMAWRFTDDLTTGVLGFTGWGNVPYMAGKRAFFFVRGRRGSALNRAARVRAYGQLQQGLLMDRSLPPALHAEIVLLAEKLGWNPFDEDVEREVRVANSQWAAIQKRIETRMPRDLERERLANLSTFGIFRHRDELTHDRLAAVARQRSLAAEQHAQSVSASLPHQSSAQTSAGGGQ